MEITTLNPITINANALRAAVHCVADSKDLRHYLRGVYVTVKQGRAVNEPRALVAGCNGHSLFVGLSEVAAFEEGYVFADNPWIGYSLIIPVDAIKAIDKRAHMVHLSQIDANTFRLGNTVFTPIDGQYPDIARVIPAREQIDAKTHTPANYQPKYLLNAQKALQTYYGSKPDTVFELAQYGTDAAIMHAGENCAQVVIMPIRANGTQGTALSTPAFNRDYL